MTALKGKNILLGVTGSVSAYKACELLRLLKKAGADVNVVLTENGRRFVGEPVFAALSGNPVGCSMWESEKKISHIQLASQADLMLIAPATANILGKAACGIADDLLSSCIIARRTPIMFAPAMNMFMWANPANQRNVETLKKDGALFSGPEPGVQACGDKGLGRFREPEDILADVERFFTPKVLEGKKVLVTAGPTFESLDPVRGMTNLSSGKQGYAVAKQAYLAGADVTLVSGPCAQKAPKGVKVVPVETAEQMLAACEKVCEEQNPDLFISVAAVTDWRPAGYSRHKLKKTDAGTACTFDFVQNPDILATIASRNNAPLCIGFAAETDNIVEYARKKLKEKKAALIVANDASVIGKETNRAFFVESDETETLEEMSKEALAEKIIQKASVLLKKQNEG